MKFEKLRETTRVNRSGLSDEWEALVMRLASLVSEAAEVTEPDAGNALLAAVQLIVNLADTTADEPDAHQVMMILAMVGDELVGRSGG